MNDLMRFVTSLADKGIRLYVEDGKLKSRADLGAITAEIGQKIKANKLELIELLQQVKNPSRQIIEIGKAPPSENQPLSFSQQRMWLLEKMDGGSNHYNMPIALRLSGKLDAEALDKALYSIVERHHSLRTCFIELEDGQPVQRVQDVSLFSVKKIDLSGLAGVMQDEALQRHVAEAAGKIFDLSRDLMITAALVKLSDTEHVVLVTLHHISSDGWSIGLLIGEISQLYMAFAQGLANPLPPLQIQYADYAYWQRNWLQKEVLDKQMNYWVKQLADLPVVHSLPLDHPRPKVQTYTGDMYRSRISLESYKSLEKVCQQQGASLFMGLHGAFAVLLSRLSNETDIVMGTSIANREQAEVEPLIGFFINSLVLRADISHNPDFTGLIAQSRDMILDVFAHQQVPFEQIVETLKPERSMRHSPLFQVMLVMQNNEEGELELQDLTLSPVAQEGCVSKFDFTLYIQETAEGLVLDWEYNPDLFETDSIARMSDNFERLINALIQYPNTPVQQVPLSSLVDSEKIAAWQGVTTDYTKDQCIHQQFEAQVSQTPDNICVEFEQLQLSYREVDQKANKLANFLMETGIESGDLVGIYLERSVEMLIAVLGVMKSGAAYVPLEPDYPPERIKLILGDAEIEQVLLHSALMETLPMSGVDVLLMDNAASDDLWLEEFSGDVLDEIPDVDSQSLLYLLYTSGSTGKPKGVMVHHQGVSNYLSYAKKTYLDGDIKGSVVSSPLCFDATLTTLLAPLLAGKTVKLLKDDDTLSVLTKVLFEQNDNWLFKITPAHLDALSHLVGDDVAGQARHIIVVGGEQLTYQALAPYRQRLLPNATFINEYGPTETVVGCTTYKVLPLNQQTPHELQVDSEAPVPIGKPIDNTRLYVMSSAMLPQPLNCIGELYIGGDGVTLGYLNRDELTHERFISHPQNPDERLYRTGDLVRWKPNGEIQFVGRVDHQVKVRGFRIELGEIENVLRTHPDVRDAVVIAHTDTEAQIKDTQLIAFVVAKKAWPSDDLVLADAQRNTFGGSCLEHLRGALPQYMVPSSCMVIDAIPLTVNGKVDNRSLPLVTGAKARETYVAPTTDTQRQICELWQELLKVERVGISDNFFALGGHSLSATRVVGQINSRFDLAISLKIIFDQQTVAELAQMIDDSIIINQLQSGELDIETLSDEELDKYLSMLPEE